MPLQNPGDYPQSMGRAQEQALGTENFQQNQMFFRKYTAVDGSLKKKIIVAVEPAFLSLLEDQLTGLRQVYTITMLQHLFSSHRVIDKIDLKGNAVKMMGPYDPT